MREEKERFFASDNYHPVFRYNWQVEKPQISSSPDNKTNLMNAIVNQDNLAIMQYAWKYFEIENWEYLGTAKMITSKTPSLEVKPRIEDFVPGFENAFKFLGLNDYQVETVDAFGFNCRPVYKLKKIQLSKYADFQFFDVEGEVRHELVHIIRYENGKYNQIGKAPNYLPTEEGLATLMHDTGKNGYISEFQHAAEYIASSIGVEGSLRDIYNYFVGIGFNNELAWQRASRHKFGFVNTETSGDILKPAMYFAHSQKLQKLENSELVRLFVGKIALSDLQNHDEYQGIVEKAKLKEFYDLDETH